MNKIYFLPFVFITFLLTVTTTVFAQSDNSKNPGAKPKLTEVKEEKANTVKTVACEKIQERIRARIQSYDANRKANEDLYKKIVAKIGTIITKLQTAGADTTQLSSDLAVLNSKIQKYWADRQVVITKIDDSSQYSCDTTDRQIFKTKLTEAKELHKVVLADAKDIRDFLTTTIKDDIKNTRESLPNQDN